MPSVPHWVRPGVAISSVPRGERTALIMSVDASRTPVLVVSEGTGRFAGEGPDSASLNNFVHQWEPVSLQERSAPGGEVLLMREEYEAATELQLWRCPGHRKHRVRVFHAQMVGEDTLFETYAEAEISYLGQIRALRNFNIGPKATKAAPSEKKSRFDREDPV